MKPDSYTVLVHKGKTIVTTVGSLVGDTQLSNSSLGENYIPAGYEHRPDLISNLFFGSPENWWVIMGMNGIFDPFESLNVGDRINVGNE